jgi:triacylglycerol esterase/lipase EstA (alpha/beta hydrolase family)
MIGYRWLMPDPAPAPATLPVLLLHGVGCNAGVWIALRRYLDAHDLGPVYALSYGPPLAAIDAFAPQVTARIAQIAAATGAARVVLVGHSMGGLVARAYLRRYGGGQVARLVTLGTPHAGSMHAWMMAGSAMADMRPGSAFLTRLNASPDHVHGVPVVSLWSWHDSMVTPQTSSRLSWAKNIVLAGVAHNALLNDPQVWRHVAEEIRKSRATPPTSESPASAGQRPSAPA